MEFKNGKSIAMQIADSLSERILNGSLPAKARIPSVRELAGEMGVNPNTIVRSYSDLQSKNIIANQRGIGYFVTKKARDIINQNRKEEFFESELPDFIRKMNVLDISYADLKSPIENLLKELKNENKQ
jgi:DNA-binding transcriptional regulator YhcF (GntR family)